MRNTFSYSLLALAMAVVLANTAQAGENSAGKPAAEVPGVPAGTVITPSSATVIAQDAYLWGWPIVNAFNRRTSFSRAPEPGLVGGILPAAPTGYISMLTDYISPEQHWIAHPNQDVVYGFGYGATDDDPMVLQVPDFGDRFWVYALYDARSEEFSKLGKQYGTQPGNYLVVGPNWKGTVPAGITQVIKAPTELVAVGPRTFLDDSVEDRQAIQPVLNQVVVYPLSKYTGKTVTKDWKATPHFPAPQKTSAEVRWVNPQTFFDQLPEVLAKVPPLAGEESRYAMIQALLDAAAKDPAVKAAIVKAAVDTEEKVVSPLFSFQTNGSRLPNGWNSPINAARWGNDHLTRTATAKSNMYTNQPEETRYFFLEVDEKGQRLHGDHRYTLTFPKGKTPPADGFWSLTMYDPQHFFAPNDLNRYSLGTKNSKSMQYNADGSLTLYVQHDSPGKDREANWLPAPKSEFEVTIRTYWPKAEVLSGAWTPPAAVRLD
ncbi:hypothetical protein J3D47_003766 [Pseudomonas laurylsulfativorans]|uniref:DUF1254 domain-containing protein n=1 Tax=Pseudomonas laurylsulfativorans TaxID=1943631 RepID=UPI00209FA2FB|nr:DUF1214 domain-containing protein [Pseudomonas laurylsulfativorans]MCP1419523.1 hypothetical protein [Pseudomonas laurylsulfativorans]